jgi:hypothetical protein
LGLPVSDTGAYLRSGHWDSEVLPETSPYGRRISPSAAGYFYDRVASFDELSKWRVCKTSGMPEFIKPQLATLKSKAPARPQWLHEIKFDGYRIQVYLNNGKRKVFTRDGLDGTKRFSQIAGTLDIRGQAIIDGEAVVIHDGRKVVEPVLAPSRKRFCKIEARASRPSHALQPRSVDAMLPHAEAEAENLIRESHCGFGVG